VTRAGSHPAAALARPIEPTQPGVVRVTEHYACVEGEGSTLGALTYLVRLSGCDLRCWWCDSKFSSFREDEARELPPAELEAAALASGAGWVSFTGGEPTWRGPAELKALAGLARRLRRQGLQVKVESNGRRLPSALAGCVDLWSVAPKFDGRLGKATAAMTWDPVTLGTLARRKAGSLQWKFVVTYDKGQPRLGDLAWASGLLLALPKAARRHPAFFIPEAYAGGDYLARVKALEEAAAGLACGALQGWDLRVQPQWHRVLHGDERRR
jgi:organic radical activating enzyme